MATLLLTAVGTALGGPLGGAIGALAGRSIDGAIIGGGKREGPRLKELAVTTSSYGQPIPRHHGRMRTAGTIIWATELTEHKDKQGGKKGQPSVTTYSYSTSFAVALSSRPIRAVGRIWADGNLLRGQAGDLKAAGQLRIHTGHGDQAPDPLIAAAQGEAACPAFRDCAYAVFEDLALADFGNRIPALTFEVIADDEAIALADLLAPLDEHAMASGSLAPLAGFANEGGPLSATLATIDTLFPLACDAGGAALTIAPQPATPASALLLPAPARGWDDDDDAPADHSDGAKESRDDAEREAPDALRYYDLARDYQPGVQRPAGRAAPGRTATLEFPGVFAPDDARALADAAARRSTWRRDTLAWRVAELDPAHAPGALVRVPGRAGIWRIESWEWRSRGIELELARLSPRSLQPPPGDPGTIVPVPDRTQTATALAVFEVPPLSPESDAPTLFAACAGQGEGAWSGAALYIDRAGELVRIAATGRDAATFGRLVGPLPPARGVLFDQDGALEVALADPGTGFASVSLGALAAGANRLLVGDEVLQFTRAEELEPGGWRLSGLLRGRGGTEPAAGRGHPAGTRAALLDETLVALDPGLVTGAAPATFAAIGAGDHEPMFAQLANTGLGKRPPCPVHARAERTADGGLALAWTRRARGDWVWIDEVDAALVEEAEAYRVGVGPTEAPHAEWSVSATMLTIASGNVAALTSAHPAAPLWVRQVGRFAQSEALLLHRLD